ncbi:P-loop containing nucleoside triphosphate hydrolase protein, partial [Violaceomyces palustris]
MGKSKPKKDPNPPPPSKRNSPGSAWTTTTNASKNRRIKRSRGEESNFSKLEVDQLERLLLVSHRRILPRPIPSRLTVLTYARIWVKEEEEKEEPLKVPKRPRWNTLMEKKTVDANESQVLFNWLKSTDSIIQRHFDRDPTEEEGRGGGGIPSIPSLFERNLEVFRQLWRVMERSDILLVLADCRFPLLHLPNSLTDFLSNHARSRTILVLTKCDLVPPSISERWKRWLESHFRGGFKVVVTQSYRRLEGLEGQGGSKRTRLSPPTLSQESRRELFKALREVHGEMITPPKWILEDEERRKRWRPRCFDRVDWDAFEADGERQVYGGEKQTHLEEGVGVGSEGKRDSPPPFITLGLIGQPNVGKSSLLNALMGSKVVRSSKTPGKTKHFQTHFLGGQGDVRSQVRLCDSPGLVFPSLVGMEAQVMGGILPISQVQSIPTCVGYVADHMRLERILELEPFLAEMEVEEREVVGKRLDSMRSRNPKSQQRWTSTKILEALARRYNYRTAKAARWDLNRAGNSLLRAVAEGRIRWAFRPP